MNEITIPPSPNWYLGDILSCNNDGVFVYGSRNDLIVCRHKSRVSLAHGPQVQMIRVAHKEKVTVVRLSKTNGGKYPHSVATVGDDSIVKLWDLETLSLLQAHNFHEGSKVVDMDWSIADPNLVVSVDENNNIICWNLSTNSTQRLTLFKLRAMCLACCPHKADTIAVGSRTGLVFVIKIKDGGQVLYRMRGHDSEVVSIAWCPVSYNIFKQSKTEQLLSRDMLLASAGKDRDVYIWRAGTDGQCQTKFNLPVTLVATVESSGHYRSGGSNAPSVGMFRMCLRWPEPSTLLTSTAWGELLKWRLTETGEDAAHKGSQKPVKDKLSKNYQLLHNIHLRGLFSIACTPAIVQDETANFWTSSTDSVPSEDNLNSEEKEVLIDGMNISKEQQLVWTTAQDRLIVACDLKTGKLVAKIPTFGGFVYAVAVSPVDSDRLAIGVGDSTIRIWNLSKSNAIDLVSMWQRVKSRVMTLAWHPTKENLIAYGTSEGRIGVCDTSSGKLPIVFKISHQKPVYSLCWGPFTYKQGEDPKNIPELVLYSCAVGEIFQHNMKKPDEDISSFLKEIQQSVNPTTSNFKFTTELAWKPDFTLLALGLDDGTVHVFSAPHLTLLHTLFTIKKMIQCLAWHPESTATDTGLSPYRHWLAVSSNERTITVVDTSKLTKGESDINNKTIKSCITLTGHLNRVVSMAWSPHVSGQLVSVSFDDTAQVWDVPNQSLVANFPSHESNLLCCVWSPLDPDMIITGSADCTLRVWKISSQTNKFPKEKKAQKKNKKLTDLLIVEATKERNEEKQRHTFEHDTGKKAASSLPVNSQASTEVFAINDRDHLTPRVISHINKKSFFPVSSRRREDDSYQIENCYRLLERGGQDEIINKDTPSEEGGELGFHHFYGNREDIHKLINAEVAEHRTKGREMLISHMELWKGNTGEMLREASRKKALNDWLVSLAPSISHRVWVEMCVAYSEQLTVQGLFHKAASYLLVCNKVEEAIQLLVNNKCFREAMCIAKSRLDSDDPTINNVFIEWGNKLGNSDGNFVQAAECYLASGELDLAAKMFAKKKTAEYLKLSALVSRKCGNYALALSQAKQCFQECMHQENWDLADDIVSEYMELKPYHLVVIVHREVLNLLAADQGKFGSWLLGNRLIDTSLLERVASRWQTDDKQTVYSELHSGLDHNQSAQQTLNQMWLCVSKELSLSFSSEEKGLWHLVNAVAICYRYQLLHPSQPVLLQLCSWLAPAGPFTKGSVFLLSSQDTSNMSFVHSLRAFLGAAIAFWLDIVVKLSEDLEQQSPLGVNGKSKNDNEQITEPNEECDAHTRDLINDKNITIKSQEINKSITVIESAEGMTDTQKVVEGVKEEVNDILEKINNVCGNKPNKEIKCNEKDDTKTKTIKEFIESKIDISSSNIDASKITCVGVSNETTCVFEHSGSLNWAAVCTVLEELLVDVLDKHSTQYFQNEIEIKKLELLVAGAVASTRKSSALGESPKHIEDNNVAEDRNENKIDDAINHNMQIEVTEAQTENGVVEGKKKDQVLFDTISDTNIIKNSILNEDNQTIADAQFGTGYSVLRGNSYLNEGEPTPTAAHLVQGHNSRDTFANSGLLKLKELKNCKEKFEMEKVAVPNPFFIYCKVQTICQNVIMKKEPQLGQRLLDLLKNSL